MVVLWLVAILGLVVSALSFHSRTELRLTSFQWDQQRLTQVAQLKAAESATFIEKSSAPLTLAELGRWEAVLFPAKTDALPLATPRTAGLTDESSRINLNKASKEMLERLTGSREAASAILDWRDADSVVSPGGAENEYYKTLPNPYPCRNSPLMSVAELLLIKGITPDLYQEIQNKSTVEGPGTVNINTASKEILEALGASPALVGKILNCRKGADGIHGTADDPVFAKIKSVPEQLEKRWPLTESDKLSWQSVERLLSVKGSALRLNVPITLDDSPSTRGCQIGLTPGETHVIRSWHEGSGWGGK
ncbi:MAG: general secretion pathway protein GspK [Elusimicrobia bacterium]|nr:general secretion pathway protein GspK [Elusimicrobiota bacterium]